MRRNGKKIMALLLSLGVLLGALPLAGITAGAEEPDLSVAVVISAAGVETGYPSLTAALAAAQAGQTVAPATGVDDWSEDVTFSNNAKGVRLNLNGMALSSESDGAPALTVAAGCELTLLDTAGDGLILGTVQNQGTLNIRDARNINLVRVNGRLGVDQGFLGSGTYNITGGYYAYDPSPVMNAALSGRVQNIDQYEAVRSRPYASAAEKTEWASEEYLYRVITEDIPVYFVFQNAEGGWSTQGLAAGGDQQIPGNAAEYHVPAQEHYTATAFGTVYSSDPARHIALSGSVVDIPLGARALYIYYTRDSYPLVLYTDHTGTAVSRTLQVPHGMALSTLEIPEPAKDNYSFEGWATSAKAEDYTYKDVIGDSKDGIESVRLDLSEAVMPTEALYLYPMFVRHRLAVHLDLGAYDPLNTASWNRNAEYDPATPASMDADQAREFTTDNGEKIRMGQMSLATRTGYDSLFGWATANGTLWNADWGTGVDYADSGALSRHATRPYSYYTITLTAQWLSSASPFAPADGKSHTLTLHLNNGEEDLRITGQAGETVTAPAAPKKSDFTLAGWRTADNTFVAALPETMPGEDVELYALWTATAFTVTLDAGEGMFSSNGAHILTLSEAPGSLVTQATLDEATGEITREGYTFGGWKLNGGITVLLPHLMPASDVTLNAIWLANQEKPSAPTVTADAASITVTAPTGAAYEFSLDGGRTWQDGPTLSGLAPARTYSVTARLKGTSEKAPSPASDATEITTLKLSRAAPAAPDHTRGVTDTQVLVEQAVSGQEYLIYPRELTGSELDALLAEDDRWTAPTEGQVLFTGLAPGSYYRVVARLAETATQYASPASAPVQVRTPTLVAKIGERPYFSLADAVLAVENGGTITLMDATAEDLSPTPGRAERRFTLDLNGNALWGSLTATQGMDVTVEDTRTGGAILGDVVADDGVITLESGLFIGGVSALNDGAVTVSGGRFYMNPENDSGVTIAPGKAVYIIDGETPVYEVGDAAEVDSTLLISQGATLGSADPGFTTTGEVTAEQAAQVAAGVTASGLGEAAVEHIRQILADHGSLLAGADGSKNLLVVPVLEVTALGYEEEDLGAGVTDKRLSLEIRAVYRLYLTDADITTAAAAENPANVGKVTLLTPETAALDTAGERVYVNVPLPAGFAREENNDLIDVVYVTHRHGEEATVLRAFVEGNTAPAPDEAGFANDQGFSRFTLSLLSPAAAHLTSSATGEQREYLTLQDAVDHAADGDLIAVLKKTPEGTTAVIRSAKTLRLVPGLPDLGPADLEITAGAGLSLSAPRPGDEAPWIYAARSTGGGGYYYYVPEEDEGPEIETRDEDYGVVTGEFEIDENGKITGVPTVTPKKGLEFLGWSIDPNNENKIINENTFTVKADTVLYAMYRGTITGNEGRAEPSRPVTRAEMAKILVSAAGLYSADVDYGKPSYTDSQVGWYVPYVAAAEKADIISGYGNGIFAPNATITRQEAAIMIVKAFGVETEEGATTDKVVDFNRVSGWAKKFVAALCENGTINGVETDAGREIQAQREVTRAEVLVMVNKYLGFTEELKARARELTNVQSPFIDLTESWYTPDILFAAKALPPEFYSMEFTVPALA